MCDKLHLLFKKNNMTNYLYFYGIQFSDVQYKNKNNLEFSKF